MATTYITDIAEVLKGELIKGSGGKVSYLLIDSRKVLFPRESLFFALRGKRNDGHLFITDLYKNGVRNFVVEEFPEQIEDFPRGNFLKVEHSYRALQKMVAWHRSKLDIPVIGITGSNGKTIVKEWIYQCVSDTKYVTRNPKSFNSQVGVPLSVWLLNEETELGVFEAGISKPDEMEILQKIIQPNIGVFTNIGDAHQENFESLEQKIDEKLKLFSNCDTIIYCSDNEEVNNRIIEINGKSRSLFTWSVEKEADVVLGKVQICSSKTEIVAKYRSESFSLILPFVDKASIENAVNTVCVLLVLKYPIDYIQNRVSNLESVGMRLELKEGMNNCTIINDSYNSDLESLHIALDFLLYQNQHSQKLLILSDIAQSGFSDRDLYKKVAVMIKQKGIDRLVGVGNNITQNGDYFELRKDFFDTTQDFIREFPFAKLQDMTILLKGARSFEFENISKLLQKQSHRTVFEVDLNAIEANLNYFKNYLKPTTGIIAMLKASGYGSGTHEIASLCQFQRVAAIAVAFPDEGYELRKSGLKIPIIVLNPEENNFQSIFEYNLEPQIYNFHSLQEINRLAGENENNAYPIHIKLDTGMHRSGFMHNELEALITEIKNCDNIRVKTIFSHLASADEPEQDEFTLEQIEMFETMSSAIMQELPYRVKRHILNSAGVERFSKYQYDFVRIGIGLYGVSSKRVKLAQAGTLKSSIAQIKNIDAGKTIGYGRKGIATKDTVIATVPIGYADGLKRSLSNGVGKFYVNGKLAPIIGNICMDICMIDVTGIEVNEGDEVEVFGKNITLKNLAKWMDTIPYEVLTSISKRVKRTYLAE